MSAGRPRKLKGFRGIPTKVSKSGIQEVETKAMLHEPNVSSYNSHIYKSFPFGLKNKGQNVCFLNSVIQVFYRMSPLYDEVMNHRNRNRLVSGI